MGSVAIKSAHLLLEASFLHESLDEAAHHVAHGPITNVMLVLRSQEPPAPKSYRTGVPERSFLRQLFRTTQYFSR